MKNTKPTDKQCEITDELVVSLAQNHLCEDKLHFSKTLRYKMKMGKLTKKELEAIKWAIEFLKDQPIYIK